MKALSLWQPWASLIAMGVKTIETRSWSTTYRGPLAIHAAKRVPGANERRVGDYRASRPRSPKDAPWQLWADAPHLRHVAVPMPLGTVVATCTLVDVVPMVDRWSQGKLIEPTKSCLTIEPCHLLLVTPGAEQVWSEMEHERPYGDFRPGRFAWVLKDIKTIDPVPARGHQQLFNWDEGDL